MTPFEKHKELGHKVSRHSHNGVDITEECEECTARFLINFVHGPHELRPTEHQIQQAINRTNK